MGYTKAELVTRRDAWTIAFKSTATELGKEHWITKSMAQLAWGRLQMHDPHPGETKDHVAQGVGYLEGHQHALLGVSRAQGGDHAEERIIIGIRKKAEAYLRRVER